MIAKKIYLSVLQVTNWNLDQLAKRECTKQLLKSAEDVVLKINALLLMAVTIYTDESRIILAKTAEKMKKDFSKKIYRDRKIIVEPVFGQIKTGGEFSLVCAVSNFKKIVNMIKAQTGYPKERELLVQAT